MVPTKFTKSSLFSMIWSFEETFSNSSDSSCLISSKKHADTSLNGKKREKKSIIRKIRQMHIICTNCYSNWYKCSRVYMNSHLGFSNNKSLFPWFSYLFHPKLLPWFSTVGFSNSVDSHVKECVLPPSFLGSHPQSLHQGTFKRRDSSRWDLWLVREGLGEIW